MNYEIKPDFSRSADFLRISDIANDTRRNSRGLLNISKSSWSLGVKEGRYPQPIRLGKRLPVWRRSDIESFIESLRNVRGKDE